VFKHTLPASLPAVTAVMPTCGTGIRRQFARTALRCWLQQTHPNRKMLILNHGQHPLVAPDIVASMNIREVMVQRPGTLGELRNLAFKYLDTPYAICWDDDDWHGPTRISVQLQAALAANVPASALTRYTTVDLAGKVEPFVQSCKYYRCGCCGGTLLFKVGAERYPALDRGEDTAFAKLFIPLGLVQVGNPPLLYVRTCHSENTSGREHILKSPEYRDPFPAADIAQAKRIAEMAFGWYAAMEKPTHGDAESSTTG